MTLRLSRHGKNGMKFVKRISRKTRWLFPNLTVLAKILEIGFSKRSYLRQVGFFDSAIKCKPLDKAGSPLPWVNYTVIQIIEERLPKSSFIFEYGSGYSTEFFSKKSTQVISCEHDFTWANIIESKNLENVTIKRREENEKINYIQAIECKIKEFDIVFIDGLYRLECLKNCPPYLSKKGIIIIDDVKTSRLTDLALELEIKGFRRLSFIGLKPGSPRGVTCTIFYRDDNILKI